MVIKNIHEKLLDTIQTLIIDTKLNMPFYGEMCLHINFKEQNTIGTCGVNVTNTGMNFFYSSPFLEKLSQKEINFILIHELFHLLFDHPKRTIIGQYDHKLSNIAQDMIINHIIWQDITHSFVEIPKSDDGKNMTLFVPKEYNGKLIFEELYEWLLEEKQKHEEKKSKCKKCGGSGKIDENTDCPDCKSDKYGPYGKNPEKIPSEPTIDTWSKESIFDNLENGTGEYLDKHIDDDVPQEMREGIIKDVIERLKARGLNSSNVDGTLDKLRKKRKDYLREIKRVVSNMIFGTEKQKTFVRPNRKQIFGVKGFRKVKTKINCILDTSGSMGGTFSRVLSFIYRNDIEVNLIEADTDVRWVKTIKDKKKLETIKIKGLGGTILQPAINYVQDKFNEYNTVILTDGYCDNLDLSKIRGKVLIISIGVKVPISKSNNKVKQIIVEKDFKN